MTHAHHTQSGSVAFLILFGIAMFAALSYVVTRDRGTNTSLMTDQQAKIAAQEIISYGNSISAAVQKLKLRGCAYNQFNVANSVWKRVNQAIIHTSGDNPNAKEGCGLFTDGNLTPVIFPRNYFADITLSSSQIDFGTGYIGTSKLPGIGLSTRGELYYILPHISEKVCLKINDLIGITNPGDAPPSITTSSYPVYKAAYSNSIDLTDSSGSITGKYAYCINNPAEGTAHRFIQVLIQQ